MKKILVLGGSGHFGKRISEALAKDNIALILAGRRTEPLSLFAEKLKKKYPDCQIESSAFDAFVDFDTKLSELKPYLVINTCGPFQGQGYSIANACIEHNVHYIDLADAREYVRDITVLNDKAKKNNLIVISGASSVPGLSSAVIEEYKSQFSELSDLKFGISSAQQTPGGIATTGAILSYAGKEIPGFAGAKGKVFGWQDLHRVELPNCGKRWMSNCSIPDLDLFSDKYGFKTIQFSGGVENSFLHLGLWVISWFVRAGLPIKLTKFTSIVYRISKWFDKFGSDAGGMFIFMKGKDSKGKPQQLKWYIIAHKNQGLHIPTIPAIVLAKKIVTGKYKTVGAAPCVGLISLDECLTYMKQFDIEIHHSLDNY